MKTPDSITEYLEQVCVQAFDAANEWPSADALAIVVALRHATAAICDAITESKGRSNNQKG